jgi:Cytochrome c
MMQPMKLGMVGACLLALASFGVPAMQSARAQSSDSGQETHLAEGKRLFRANCAGCHKWHGGGGGGYGGAALSLRNTHLNRDQIIETVSCGRPGTGMPYHRRDAYDSDKCYGLKKSDIEKMMPPEAANFLRPPEIAAITDYVLARVKGRGEPNYAQCIEFFGEGSRVCNTYKNDQKSAGGEAAGTK